MKAIGNLTIIEGPQDELSADFPALFSHGGVHFCSARQFVAYKKAQLFRDFVTAKRILECQDPVEIDSLSKTVRGFDESNWSRHRLQFLQAGSLAKFEQNPELASVLENTGDTELVVANSVNGIWGITLPADSPDLANREKWSGLNLDGKALLSTRALLQERKQPRSRLRQDATPDPVSNQHKIDICSSWDAGFSVVIPRENWLPELQALPKEVLKQELHLYMKSLNWDLKALSPDACFFTSWVEHCFGFSLE
jgi:ribA/ribD-fused uncharacterized protein